MSTSVRQGESGDGFLYARCYIVASGEEHFRSVTLDPSQHPTMEAHEICELLLYVAVDASTTE